MEGLGPKACGCINLIYSSDIRAFYLSRDAIDSGSPGVPSKCTFRVPVLAEGAFRGGGVG